MKAWITTTAIAGLIATPFVVNHASNSGQAQSSSSPIEVRPYFGTNLLGQLVPSLQFLSKVDNVEMQSIVLNRGNCSVVVSPVEGALQIDSNSLYSISFGKIEGWEPVDYRSNHIWRKPGYSLKYGEALNLGTSCNQILEITVKTNLGEWFFKPQN
jgi:hypothetical protein